MTIQTVELAGHRFVILPEEEFQQLARDARSEVAIRQEDSRSRSNFARVTPLKVSGIPASEFLLQDRR